MPKNSISDLVASDMHSILNSEEHASLFKKAYVQKEAAAPAASPAAPAKAAPVPAKAAPVAKAPSSMPSKADDNDADKGCPKCNRSKDNCYCGDTMMADDNDVSMKEKTCMDCNMAKAECKCEHNKVSDEDESWAKESKACDVAVENLLTASAALDYVGLVKGSELALKLAALVAEAKKGKVNLKKSKKMSKNVKKDDKKDTAKAADKLNPEDAKKAEKKLKELRQLSAKSKPKSK